MHGCNYCFLFCFDFCFFFSKSKIILNLQLCRLLFYLILQCEYISISIGTFLQHHSKALIVFQAFHCGRREP